VGRTVGKDRHWRQSFAVAGGEVWASSYDHPNRESRLLTDPPADIVLVLFDHDDPVFGLWTAPGRAPVCRRVHWPKLATPPEFDALLSYLREVRGVLTGGGRAEVFCFGGHGRTGTALACLAVLGGEEVDAAIERVRRDYCARAVSTPELEDVVRQVASLRMAG
jgi:hypothetical protein